MMCMTELHGGVCHRTSIPHKSGNKMKEKKKKSIDLQLCPRVLMYRAMVHLLDTYKQSRIISRSTSVSSWMTRIFSPCIYHDMIFWI